MFLKLLVSKGKREKYVIGSKYAFDCTKTDHSSALDPQFTDRKCLLIRQQFKRYHLSSRCQSFTQS